MQRKAKVPMIAILDHLEVDVKVSDISVETVILQLKSKSWDQKEILYQLI